MSWAATRRLMILDGGEGRNIEMPPGGETGGALVVAVVLVARR